MDGAQFERLDAWRFLAAVQPEIHQKVVYHSRHTPGGIPDGLCVAHTVVCLRVVQQQLGVQPPAQRAQAVGVCLHFHRPFLLHGYQAVAELVQFLGGRQ